MGIVNVTPDSFSDGGKFIETDRAIDHALKLASEGAGILDIGGESTRPYSQSVDQEDELDRVIPVIRGLAKQTDIPISIDTTKAHVARAAMDEGAQIINDVTGLEGDPEMIAVALNSGAGVCAMHMQGTPQTMQDHPSYQDVVREIHAYLVKRKIHLLDAGIPVEKICLDPGIGFGKSHRHNLELLNHCEQYLDLDCPILIGHSRKGMIGKILGDPDANRDSATMAITLMLARKKIQVVRVHEVRETVRALKAFAAVGGIDGQVSLPINSQ
ncbi:dihydropteroate synthase [bacterium]|nr:dihydropteroate synthase [bacterium]MDA7880366.1 dihydropteroate synthase [Mariniblastus sp.]MDA7884889.1 dihydropteroate synthase [bacterium]MDA7906100.1 dihydropteroate synthase [Mariniblastus sp.]MDA7912022.1 dihydropteroate synthase [bacterium]